MKTNSFDHRPHSPLHRERRMINRLGVRRFDIPDDDSRDLEKPVELEDGRINKVSQNEFRKTLEANFNLIRDPDAYKEREIRKQMKWEWDRDPMRLRFYASFAGRQGKHRVYGRRGNMSFVSRRFTEHRGDFIQRKKIFMAERRQMRFAFEERNRAWIEAKVDEKLAEEGSLLTEDEIGDMLDYATDQVFKSDAVAERGSAKIQDMLTLAYKELGEKIYEECGGIPVELAHLFDKFGEMKAPGTRKSGKYLGVSTPRILRKRNMARAGISPPETPYFSHKDVEDLLEEVKAQKEYTIYHNVFEHQYDIVDDPIADGDEGSQAIKIARALGLTDNMPDDAVTETFMFEQLTKVLDDFDYREIQKLDPSKNKPQIVEYNKESMTAMEARMAKRAGKDVDPRGRRGILVMEGGEVLYAIEYSEMEKMVHEWYGSREEELRLILPSDQSNFLAFAAGEPRNKLKRSGMYTKGLDRFSPQTIYETYRSYKETVPETEAMFGAMLRDVGDKEDLSKFHDDAVWNNADRDNFKQNVDAYKEGKDINHLHIIDAILMSLFIDPDTKEFSVDAEDKFDTL